MRELKGNSTVWDTDSQRNKIDLSWCLIRDEGAESLAKTLEGNYSLHELNLGANLIGNDGAGAFASVLNELLVREMDPRGLGLSNCPLQSLSLWCNDKMNREHPKVKKLIDVHTKAKAFYDGLDESEKKVLGWQWVEGFDVVKDTVISHKTIPSDLKSIRLDKDETAVEFRNCDDAFYKGNSAGKQWDEWLKNNLMPLDAGREWDDWLNENLKKKHHFKSVKVSRTNAYHMDLDRNLTMFAGEGSYGLEGVGKENSPWRQLEKLELEKIAFGANGGKLFSELVRLNDKLLTLSIQDCRFEDDSVRELAKGLSNNFALDVLRLSNNDISDRGVISLSKALKISNKCELMELCLKNNSIMDEGFLYLLGSLKDDTEPSLKKLNLETNKIGTMEKTNARTENRGKRLAERHAKKVRKDALDGLRDDGALLNLWLRGNKLGRAHQRDENSTLRILWTALEKNQKLTTLDLSFNKLGEHDGQFNTKTSSKTTNGKMETALRNNSNLKELNLSYNWICRGTALIHLCRGLEANKTLQTLDLSDCDLTDNHAKLIAKHIVGRNRVLQNLILHTNMFTENGISYLIEALKKNWKSALVKLDVANQHNGRKADSIESYRLGIGACSREHSEEQPEHHGDSDYKEEIQAQPKNKVKFGMKQRENIKLQDEIKRILLEPGRQRKNSGSASGKAMSPRQSVLLSAVTSLAGAASTEVDNLSPESKEDTKLVFHPPSREVSGKSDSRSRRAAPHVLIPVPESREADTEVVIHSPAREVSVNVAPHVSIPVALNMPEGGADTEVVIHSPAREVNVELDMPESREATEMVIRPPAREFSVKVAPHVAIPMAESSEISPLSPGSFVSPRATHKEL